MSDDGIDFQPTKPDDGIDFQPQIGKPESFGRAVANNVPMLPQVIAKGESVTGLGDEGGYSKNLEDWNAKAAAAKAANPWTYGTGAVVGAVAPALIPGVGEAAEAAPLLTGAGFGAANALSNEDLSKNPVENLKKAGIGAGLGAGTSAVTGAIADKLIPKIATMATSPEAVASKLENPSMKAGDLGEMTEGLPDIYGKMKTAATGVSKYGDSLLSTSPYIEEGAIPKDDILAVAKSALGDIRRGSDEGKAAFKTIVGKQTQLGKLHETVSEQGLKAVIGDIDKEINWDRIRFQAGYKPTLEEQSLMKLRGGLDDLLKENNPKYAEQMKIVDDLLSTSKQFGKNFGLLKREGEIVPGNRSLGPLKNALKPENVETQRLLGKTKELTGEDLENPLRLRQFEGPTPESPMGIPSRAGGTVVGAGLGSGLGLGGVGLGGLVGNRVLRKPMSELGRSLAGSALGATQSPLKKAGVNQAVIDYLTSKLNRRSK